VFLVVVPKYATHSDAGKIAESEVHDPKTFVIHDIGKRVIVKTKHFGICRFGGFFV
jgi:hypothetical protein